MSSLTEEEVKLKIEEKINEFRKQVADTLGQGELPGFFRQKLLQMAKDVDVERFQKISTKLNMEYMFQYLVYASIFSSDVSHVDCHITKQDEKVFSKSVIDVMINCSSDDIYSLRSFQASGNWHSEKLIQFFSLPKKVMNLTFIRLRDVECCMTDLLSAIGTNCHQLVQIEVTTERQIQSADLLNLF